MMGYEGDGERVSKEYQQEEQEEEGRKRKRIRREEEALTSMVFYVEYNHE